MAVPSEPQDVGAGAAPATGQHLLGPHVVGQRVVVRRVVPGEVGPTGGPAFTDLLGTCLAWTPGPGGSCVLQPDARAGEPMPEPVWLALADIVSGKPVPPRPSHRLRVEPREAQLRALALWPDLVTEELDGWLLRHSPASPNRRANSVLALGPPGCGLEAAEQRVLAFYAATTGRPVAAVLVDGQEEAALRGRGWVLESDDADTVFSVAGVAAARRALRAVGKVDGEGEVELEQLAPGVVRADLPGASGVAAYDRDWVGFRSLRVDPAHRRRGLGLRVMAALLGWGAEQGATTAYLQVLADNAPALALYDRLGFVEHHRYRYLALEER
ncbi:GNAT family N-acetyltransferase [Nocardioides sp. SOB77]|uniref:GNAT family N-acetyltransferase n=1 Tax=Nocardioides oceani TaxID=3058369 RepID=A0ABT8FCK5_9ACTN|nr:GNAT family N-acetyltransferase [Nocardioides oceani]MDN4172417.1 GNAT family N-acetyltransferase [Nocardioides oceani]